MKTMKMYIVSETNEMMNPHYYSNLAIVEKLAKMNNKGYDVYSSNHERLIGTKYDANSVKEQVDLNSAVCLEWGGNDELSKMMGLKANKLFICAAEVVMSEQE